MAAPHELRDSRVAFFDYGNTLIHRWAIVVGALGFGFRSFLLWVVGAA